MVTGLARSTLGLTVNDWQTLDFLSHDPDRIERELNKWISTGYIDAGQAARIWDETYRRHQMAQARAIYGTQPAEGVAPTPTQMVAAYPTYTPQPRYEPALEELRESYKGEVPQTENWMDWFRSKYPRLMEQFEAKLPRQEPVSYEQSKVIEAQTEKSWADFLKSRKSQLKEEYYKQTPYMRGERPSAFAPRITSIRF